MIRRPPRSTRTDTILPYTTLFLSFLAPGEHAASLYPVLDHPERFGHVDLVFAEVWRRGIQALAQLGFGHRRSQVAPCAHGRIISRALDDPCAIVQIRRHVQLSQTCHAGRSEERRVGKECGSECIYRMSPYT